MWSRQQGFGMAGASFYLIVGGLALTCLLTLGPHYIDNFNVQSGFDKVAEEYAGKDINDISNGVIKDKLQRHFQISRIDESILKEVEIVREGNSVLITVDYEQRQNFLGNVDVVLMFHNEVEL